MHVIRIYTKVLGGGGGGAGGAEVLLHFRERKIISLTLCPVNHKVGGEVGVGGGGKIGRSPRKNT